MNAPGAAGLRFAGKTVVVTGGGRGIGAATAQLLASEGARVMVTSRTLSELESTVKLNPKNMMAHVCDVSDEASVQALFERLMRELGPCDILVNNAAVFIGGPLETASTLDWDRTMAVNLRGPFLCTRAAFAQMRGRGGAIVNISSLGGIRSTQKFPGMSAYVASKAGVIGLTEAAAVEGKPLKIRVNCVAPGAVATEMLRRAAPHLKTETTPDDIARVIAGLCDEAQSGALTGSVVEIHSNR